MKKSIYSFLYIFITYVEYIVKEIYNYNNYLIFLMNRRGNLYILDNIVRDEEFIRIICKKCGNKIYGITYCYLDEYYCSEYCRFQVIDEYNLKK